MIIGIKIVNLTTPLLGAFCHQ